MRKKLKKWFFFLDFLWRNNSYSQEGEDLFLKRYFKNQNKGIYLDIGANHPKRFSNTYFLYTKGWSGFAIDPNPLFVNEWRKMRPNDKFENIGVGREKGNMKYFFFKDNAYNTFSEERANELINEKGKDILVGVKDILIDKLENIFPEIGSIDLLSIDAEGMDEVILKSIDLNQLQPKLVVLEAHSQSSKNSLESYMLTKNYTLRSFLYYSLIFERIQ